MSVRNSDRARQRAHVWPKQRGSLVRQKLFRLIAGVSMAASAMVMSAVAASAGPATDTIKSRHDSRCVKVIADTPAPDVQVGTCEQRFHTVWYEDAKNYEIRTADYWCLDGRAGRGGALERQPCTGAISQRWRIVDDPNTSNLFTKVIKSVEHPGLVWDVHNHGAGTTVQLWDDIGGAHQSWLVARIANPAA
jgi:hypothetical protein